MRANRPKAAAARVLRSWLARLRPDFLETALYRSLLKHHYGSLFASKKIEVREDVWDYAVHRIGAECGVLFLEFGVHRGYSICHFARRFTHPKTRLFGFDSFEGLPEDWGRKPAGTFSTGGAFPETDDARITFVRGWFQDTLPSFATNAQAYDNVLVHLDADLYSSTLFVLSQLWLKLRSFYAIFDEFSGHEARALYNFSQAFPSRIEFLAHDHPFPNRVLCRIDVKRDHTQKDN